MSIDGWVPPLPELDQKGSYSDRSPKPQADDTGCDNGCGKHPEKSKKEKWFESLFAQCIMAFLPLPCGWKCEPEYQTDEDGCYVVDADGNKIKTGYYLIGLKWLDYKLNTDTGCHEWVREWDCCQLPIPTDSAATKLFYKAGDGPLPAFFGVVNGCKQTDAGIVDCQVEANSTVPDGFIGGLLFNPDHDPETDQPCYLGPYEKPAEFCPTATATPTNGAPMYFNPTEKKLYKLVDASTNTYLAIASLNE